MLRALCGFQPVTKYQELVPYLGQIVAVKGSNYFRNSNQAFSGSDNDTKFAHVSSRSIDCFQGGVGYHLNTLYKSGAATSATIANQATLKAHDLSVRMATEPELQLIKKAVASSSAAFSDVFCPEAPEEADRILEHI